MTPSQIIAEARKLTATDSANYTDAQGIIDFNIVYQDVISDVISELDEDYFWNQIKADTVANQNEYTIDDTETSPNFRINHVNKVAIKYGANDSYTDATRINPNDMERDEDFYETNQPKTSPIYYVADNSVFVFPKPTDAVTEGLKLTVILQPNDLTTSSAETDVAVQPRFHKVIIAGMRARIF